MKDSDILNSPLEDFDTLDFSTLRRRSNSGDEPDDDALETVRGRSRSRSVHHPGKLGKNAKRLVDDADKENSESMGEEHHQDEAEVDDIEEILNENEDLRDYDPVDKIDVADTGYGSDESLEDHDSEDGEGENDVDITSGGIWTQMFTATEIEEASTSNSLSAWHPSPSQRQPSDHNSIDDPPNGPADDLDLSLSVDNPTNWSPPRIDYASVLSEEYQAIARAHQSGLSDSRSRSSQKTLESVLQRMPGPPTEQEQPVSDVTRLSAPIWPSSSPSRRTSDNIYPSSLAAHHQLPSSSPSYRTATSTHFHSPTDHAAATPPGPSHHQLLSDPASSLASHSTWRGNPSLQPPQTFSVPVNEGRSSSPFKSPPPPSSSIRQQQQYYGPRDTSPIFEESRRSPSPLIRLPIDQTSRQASPSRPDLPTLRPIRLSSSISDLNSASRQASSMPPPPRRSLSPKTKTTPLTSWVGYHRNSSPIRAEQETTADVSKATERAVDSDVDHIKQEEREVEDHAKRGDDIFALEEYTPEPRPSDVVPPTSTQAINKYSHQTRSRKALSTVSIITVFLFIFGLVAPPREFPMPDLIKLSNLALSFEPLIYYSGNEIQQINVLNNMGAAVWDLGYSVKISDMAESPSIAIELSDLSDSLTSLSQSLTKFFTGINSDVDSTLLVVDWARRQLQPLTRKDNETNFVMRMLRNLHEFTAQVLSPGSAGGGIESLFTNQNDGANLPRRRDRYVGLTPAGRKLFYILGPTETQRADAILVWVFREMFTVLEKAIVEELTTASGLFVLFDTIDRHFDNIAHLTAREKDTLEQGQNELLGSLWARVLGKRAWRIHKFESNKKLLSEVRSNIVSNKQKLLHCHGKLLALKLSLEALRKRLSPPLLNHEGQNNVGHLVKHSTQDDTYHIDVPSTSTVFSHDSSGSHSSEVLRDTHASFISTSTSYSFIADLNAQIRGLGSTYNYLKGARDRHKEALWEFVYGTRQEPIGPLGVDNSGGWR